MTRRSSQTVHPAAARAGGNIMTIASGKGGVGKTLFSISLAQALARQGAKILLFDGDLGLANIDIQLGLSVEYDLGDVLAGKVSLAGAVTRFGDGGFDIIAGRSGTGSLATLPARRVAELRDQLFNLAGGYDFALIDLSAGVDQPVRTLTAENGICLVVTTAEPTSLTDAYAFVKVTSAAMPKARYRFVVNMAADEQEGQRTFATLRKACEQFLGMSPPLAGVVRRDPRVPDSIRAQMPLLIRHPDCDAARDIDAIAGTLLIPA